MEKVDYQTIYDKQYEKVYSQHKIELEKALKDGEKFKLWVKLDKFKKKLDRDIYSIGNRPNENGYDVGIYFDQLVKEFDNRTIYDNDPIAYFLEDNLERLKGNYANETVKPELLKLTEIQTVECIATYKASLTFHRDICGIIVRDDDSTETIIERIGKEPLITAIEQLESDIQTKDETKKIEWLGSQKQLAELFIELQKKGWINKLQISIIKSAFTKSNTIEQTLKPGYDSVTKRNEYPEIYTAKYKARFDKIKAW